MELNELALSTINSTYLKNYLNKINYKFTLSEQLTIIYNSDLILQDKYELYSKYISSDDVDSKLKEKIKYLMESIKKVYWALEGISDFILVYMDSDDRAWCSKTIKGLEPRIDKSESITIEIHDIFRVKLIGYITLNEDLEPIRYDLVKDSMECSSIQEVGIENKYIDIPNDINVYDVVTVSNDEIHEEYVVISDSKIPETIKDNADYFDASVTVVPVYVLDTTKTFKEQIDKIIAERINDLDKDVDILSVSHTHLHLTNVEKVE